MIIDPSVDTSMLCSCSGAAVARQTCASTHRTDTAADLVVSAAAGLNCLDPAKVGQTFGRKVDLAYDPLIDKAPEGSLQPLLTGSWSYLGRTKQQFELNLRPAVTFSDGTALTAEV